MEYKRNDHQRGTFQKVSPLQDNNEDMKQILLGVDQKKWMRDKFSRALKTR